MYVGVHLSLSLCNVFAFVCPCVCVVNLCLVCSTNVNQGDKPLLLSSSLDFFLEGGMMMPWESRPSWLVISSAAASKDLGTELVLVIVLTKEVAIRRIPPKTYETVTMVAMRLTVALVLHLVVLVLVVVVGVVVVVVSSFSSSSDNKESSESIMAISNLA